MSKKTVWAPMPTSQRAKQFAPFQALKGFEEAIARKEKIVIPRRELAEDFAEEINRALIGLEMGEIVTVVYYWDLKKEYQQLTGSVTKTDPVNQNLQIGDTVIAFRDILQLRTKKEEARSSRSALQDSREVNWV